MSGPDMLYKIKIVIVNHILNMIKINLSKSYTPNQWSQ